MSKKKNSGHKVGYCPAWKQQYPWVVTVEQVDGSVIGLLCELCRLQNATLVKLNKASLVYGHLYPALLFAKIALSATDNQKCIW